MFARQDEANVASEKAAISVLRLLCSRNRQPCVLHLLLACWVLWGILASSKAAWLGCAWISWNRETFHGQFKTFLTLFDTTFQICSVISFLHVHGCSLRSIIISVPSHVDFVLSELINKFNSFHIVVEVWFSSNNLLLSIIRLFNNDLYG